jgi:hypothetical protein
VLDPAVLQFEHQIIAFHVNNLSILHLSVE